MNVKYWKLYDKFWILNLNVEFEYWPWILNIEFWVLNLNIESEYWMLNVECWILNVECWILNVKVKYYWGWVSIFSLQTPGVFVSADVLEMIGWGRVVLVLSDYCAQKMVWEIPSSRHNGINWFHCWMWNLCRIRLDLLKI